MSSNQIRPIYLKLYGSMLIFNIKKKDFLKNGYKIWHSIQISFL